MEESSVEKFSEFDRAYFIQTRQEIDTEKRERDHILNFAIVVLGALGFAVIQEAKLQELIARPIFLAFEVSALLILTSLFWVRWMKLRQIADRWYTLDRLLKRNYGNAQANEYMEPIVLKGFSKSRYLKKDVVLCIALSLPIYCLVILTSNCLSPCSWFKILIPILVIGFHLAISVIILGRKFKDPFHNIERRNKTNETVEPPASPDPKKPGW